MLKSHNKNHKISKSRHNLKKKVEKLIIFSYKISTKIVFQLFRTHQTKAINNNLQQTGKNYQKQ